MTTSNKNFKVKNGLEVLGTSATVDGNQVLTIASSINALADVDLTGAVEGNSLVFDASLNLIPGEGSGGGVAKYIVSDTKPLNAEEGVVWYNSTTGEAFIYLVDEDSSQFVEVGTFGPTGATGPQGPAGADGADSTVPGPQGEQGESGIVAQAEPPEDTSVLWYDTDAPGYGIPLGGTTGQVLSKVDSQDFNTEWSTPYTQLNANSDIADSEAALRGGVNTDLDTLGKIADAIDNDPTFSTSVFTAINAKADTSHEHVISSVSGLQQALDAKAQVSHTHNNLYYEKGYIDDVLQDKADTVHSHDDLYYTEVEVDSLLSAKAPLVSPEITGSASMDYLTVNEDLVINGDLILNGTSTTVNSTNLEVTDSLIYLASNQYDSDSVDIGIFGAYGDSSPGHVHSGLVRDASDGGKWKLISNAQEPTSNVIDFANVTYDTLKVGAIETSSATIGEVSNTEIQYLNGVTSSIQTQIDGKSAVGHTHPQSDVTDLVSDLALKAPKESPTFTGTVAAPVINATTSMSTGTLTTTGSVTVGTTLGITGTTTAAAINSGTITATGNVNPQATNSYDLGTSSLRWRNIYTQDLHLSNGIGDYTVIEGTEELYLVNNNNGKHFKFALIEVDPSEVPAKSESD